MRKKAFSKQSRKKPFVSGRRARRNNPPRKRGPISKRVQKQAEARLGAPTLDYLNKHYGKSNTQRMVKNLSARISDQKERRLKRERKERAGRVLKFFETKRKTTSMWFPAGLKKQWYYESVEGRFTGKKIRKKTFIRRFKMEPYNRIVDSLKIALDLPRRDVQKMVKDLRENAENQMRKFKKTKRYKNLTPSEKRRYTMAWAKRRTISALWKYLHEVAGVDTTPLNALIKEGRGDEESFL